MLIEAKEYLAEFDIKLNKLRQSISRKPGLALIWVGDDQSTRIFIKAKQKLAAELDINFFLHHFTMASSRQLSALIESLNKNTLVNGIVLQLPVPQIVDVDEILETIEPLKDVDALRKSSLYQSPSAAAAIQLLLANNINPKDHRTVILGAGRLIGRPLMKLFQAKKWPVDQVDRNAVGRADFIRDHSILIAATGVKNLVIPAMVHKQMLVIDASGEDVDTAKIEPLVKAVSAPKGAIGPLTVRNLMTNLLKGLKSRLV